MIAGKIIGRLTVNSLINGYSSKIIWLFKKVNNQFVNFKEEGIYIKLTMEITVTYLERTKDNKLGHPALK